jgi:hypothetical protein
VGTTSTLLAGVIAVAGVFGIGATGAVAASPSTITVTIDDTFFLPGTSAACGFDVYGHDYGWLMESTTYLPRATRVMNRHDRPVGQSHRGPARELLGGPQRHLSGSCTVRRRTTPGATRR